MSFDYAKAHAQVLKKAVSDPKFRADLLKDARATLEKELGVKLPPGITVKVVEDSASVVHLALPPAKDAISEKDLHSVAGGGGRACYNNTQPYGW